MDKGRQAVPTVRRVSYHRHAMRHPLHPHPAQAVPPWQIGVAVTRLEGGLELVYRIQGDLARLCLPAAVAKPGFSDHLWQHTCLEAFIGRRGLPAYREFNFAPHGAWAVYDFVACRERADLPRPTDAPVISFARTEGELCLIALIPAALLPEDAAELGLTAVLEAIDGTLSYFALSHPGERPDFHDRRAWLACLGPGV